MAYSIDHRETNPGLHRLYVEYAMLDLATIDKAIRMLDRCSHTNLMPIMHRMYRERAKLVKEDAAFAEADRLIQIAKTAKPGPQPPIPSPPDMVGTSDGELQPG